MDHLILARRLDLVLPNKKKKKIIIEWILLFHRVKIKTNN